MNGIFKILLTGYATKLWFVCMAISSSASPIYMAQKRSNKGKKNSRGKETSFQIPYQIGGGGGEIMIWYSFKAPLKYIEALTIFSIY